MISGARTYSSQLLQEWVQDFERYCFYKKFCFVCREHIYFLLKCNPDTREIFDNECSYE